MASSVNRGYPLPSEENDVDQEFWTLMLSTIPMIDHDIQSLFDALAGKADADHEHGVTDIAGLVDALAGKMPASRTFAFAELSDVIGMDVAPDGYVPVKMGGQLVMMSMAAAMDGLQVTMGQVTGLGDILNLLAPLASPDFSGVPTAPTATLGSNSTQLATTAFVQASVAALNDYWALQPHGVPIPVWTHFAGVSGPPTDKGYRYIKLTASDPYNDGVLVNESVSGSSPNITATAEISFLESPMNGATVDLINTDARFVRANSSGTKQQSQNLQHSHSGSTNSTGAHSHGGVISSSGGGSGFNTGSTNATPGSTSSAGAHSHTLTINNSGGNEARPANIGAEYFMRIR